MSMDLNKLNQIRAKLGLNNGKIQPSMLKTSFLRSAVKLDDSDETFHGSQSKKLITKYGFYTRMGYNPSNPTKENQDWVVSYPNLLNDASNINLLTNEEPEKIHMFGICKILFS